MNSLVSIIIPTYNRAHLISETLDSIVVQSYTDWECIVIDDGSTDTTAALMEDYISKDARFRYYNRPVDRPKGGNTCRNYGFELSKGNYIKFFDSDDLMMPNFLEKQIAIMENNPTLDFCACQWKYFSENGDIQENHINLNPENSLSDFFFNRHVFATPAPLWRRNFLKDKSLFDPALFRAQESDFHFRMLSFDPVYKMHGDFLFNVRRGHPSIEHYSTNLKSQASVMNYFEKAYDRTKEIEFHDKIKVQYYLVYRVLNQSINLILAKQSFWSRLSDFPFLKKLWKFRRQLGFGNCIRLCFGLLLNIVFRKGHSVSKSAIAFLDVKPNNSLKAI